MNKMALLMVVVLSGCTTIHFDNGPEVVAPPTTEQWHHNFVLALYEGSDPVDLEEECRDGDWQSVKTELTFINGLAQVVANLVLPIWYPKTVQVTCEQ